MITTVLNYVDSILGYLPFLFFVTLFSVIFKIYIFTRLILNSPESVTSKRPRFFLLLVLFSSAVVDSAWIVEITKSLWIPSMDYRWYLFWLRISWGFFALQYQALTLFIASLTQHTQSSLSLWQKVCSIISAGFFMFDGGLAIVNFQCLTWTQRPEIELVARTAENIYLLAILMPLSLTLSLWKLRTQELPNILKQQLWVLIPLLIVPVWFLDILQMFPLAFSFQWSTNSYSAVSLATIIITIALFYCSRKVVNLRFLNFHDHVQSKARFNFIDGFKDVLEQLGHATSTGELRHITQTLFKEAFDIPLNKTKLYIRKINLTDKEPLELINPDNKIADIVESFFSAQTPAITSAIAHEKIIIYDEIVFNNFYNNNVEYPTIINFLTAIDADIFLPIYEKQNLIAYIIVEKHARAGRFYGNVEHDEMLVFASYLANIINLLQSRNLKVLLAQEKNLREELYQKHQEINQYKESIRSFLRNTQQKEIGIIFYKNRNFIFGNKAAKELIYINVNSQEGHPLSKALRLVAQHVQEYKAPYSSFAYDKAGNRLVLAGVPNLEQNNVIITIYYPEISDIVKKQLDMLHDPSNWDYLLYLETTASGKLINQLIPGNGETLLHFKIDLLKIALSKKAILLEMAQEDLLPTVEILHHISLREVLHILKLNGPSRTHETAITLFGINPILGVQQPQKPLLEQLNNTGTLFIQNIHFLDLETQELLAEFIRYGLYRKFKSDQKATSNVRIICSSSQNLAHLVQEELFSKALFNELKQTALSMPSLLTLPEHELTTLTDGFIEQIVKSQDLKNLLELSEKEKSRIMHNRPLSLLELKERIQSLLTNKSKKNHIYKETQFDPAYQLADQNLIEAARLGKQALKDPKLMSMLWDKFKSQTKIATFLKVNRSSVSRRCKDFKLE